MNTYSKPSKPLLTLLKIGGGVVEEEVALKQLLYDFSHLKGAKVLVHGGGKSASRMARDLGIEVKMVEGRRITDAAMLEIVMMVFGGRINTQIVAVLQSMKINAIGLTGADMNLIQAHKRPVEEIDYGFVGDVDEINHQQLQQLIELGTLPVIAPLTHDGKGQMLNTNADTVASMLAQALSQHYQVRLVLCFEKAGVLLDAEDDDSVMAKLTPEVYAGYKAQGIIYAGMIPKLDNAFAAVKAGVSEVCICDRKGLISLEGEFSGTKVFRK